MESLRDILRGSLHKSLHALTPADRLTAAWPIAAGHHIAERSEVVELRGEQAVVRVADAAWLQELRAMAPRVVADLQRVSGVPLTDILFLAAQDGRTTPPARRGTTL